MKVLKRYERGPSLFRDINSDGWRCPGLLEQGPEAAGTDDPILSACSTMGSQRGSFV